MKSPDKRDFVKELKAYIARNNLDIEGSIGSQRLNQIAKVFLELQNLPNDSILRPELERHIIVSLVAIIQSSARRSITLAIDEKELRGDELPEIEAKITLQVARELKNKSFSFGELVAHFSAVSSIEGLSNSLQRTIGSDLKEALRAWMKERDSTQQVDEERITHFWITLSKMFELRNVVAHEDSFNFSVSKTDLYEFVVCSLVLDSSFVFLDTQHITR